MYVKAKINYVDLSKWTTIISGYHIRHFYDFFKTCFESHYYYESKYGTALSYKMGGSKICLKDSHHAIQIMSHHHAEYKCILQTRKIQCFTSIHTQKLTILSAIWNCYLKLHNSLKNCNFRKMSRYHAGDEFLWLCLAPWWNTKKSIENQTPVHFCLHHKLYKFYQFLGIFAALQLSF